MGAVFAALAQAGRDKITIVTAPGLESFGAWAEQLIAESTGKEGKGLCPSRTNRSVLPSVYGTIESLCIWPFPPIKTRR